MRFSSQNKGTRGFTLVEILIIAPVVVLVISGFVALMITIVGDVLSSRDQSNMSFEIQDALDRIEQDTRLTTQFLATTGTQIAPQGSDSNFTGTAAFTASSSQLIMGSLATDKNPADSTRKLIFYAKQPNDCGAQEVYNRPLQAKIVYFIKSGSLWRRAILPDNNTNPTADDNTVCTAPWQQNSCSPGYGGATRCLTNDIEVMKNVKTFNVKYLSAAGGTTDIGAAQALSAETIEVTIDGEKTTAGRVISTSGTIRGTKLNNIDVDLPAPSTPSVASTVNGASVTFSWSPVPVATSYVISYNVNGGSWINATTNAQTTNYLVNAGQGNTVTIRVAAKNGTGTSPNAISTALIPLWYTPSLQNNWQSFDSTPPGTGGYSTPSYTKTSADVVVLKGVIKDGSTALESVIMRLPVGYRPTHRLIFQTDTAGGPSRIDIRPNGDVLVGRASSSWLILDGIRFVSSTAGNTWSDLSSTFQNGWTNYSAVYGGEWAPLRSTLDSVGRAHFQGLVHGGTNVNPTTIATLPGGQQASGEYIHLPASSTGFNYTAFGAVIHAKGLSNATDYYSLQGMFYPTTSGWTTLTLQNGWVPYDTGHTQPRYRKGSDGIVSVKGLLRSGNATPGTVIATLPVGFRPKERLCIANVSNGAHSRIDILSNGEIIVASANNTWNSLDNISFIAEQ